MVILGRKFKKRPKQSSGLRLMMDGSGYPNKLLDKCWEVKLQRGRTRKTCKQSIDEIFASLRIEKVEAQRGHSRNSYRF